jgi:hypothetical protein
MKPGVLPCALALLGLGPSGDDPVAVGFAVLAGFDYVEGEPLPGEVTKLDQQKVKISGFMRREDGGSGPCEYFMLVNDACGCQGTPKLNEIVFCAMPEGETAEIAAAVVAITGTLYVGETKEDGVVVGIYDLDVDSIDTGQR